MKAALLLAIGCSAVQSIKLTYGEDSTFLYDDNLLQTSTAQQSKLQKFTEQIEGPADLEMVLWNQARNLLPADEDEATLKAIAAHKERQGPTNEIDKWITDYSDPEGPDHDKIDFYSSPWVYGAAFTIENTLDGYRPQFKDEPYH